jgi:hypothetical protein
VEVVEESKDEVAQARRAWIAPDTPSPDPPRVAAEVLVDLRSSRHPAKAVVRVRCGNHGG